MRHVMLASLLATAVFCSACQRADSPAPQQIVVGPPLYSLEVHQQNGKVTSLSATEPITITPSSVWQGVSNIDASLDPGNQLTIKGGMVVANGNDGGPVKPGDSVRLDKDGRLLVNGQERLLKPVPQPPPDPNGNRVIAVNGGAVTMWSGEVIETMPFPGITLKVVDKDGSAALQFKRWLLLFEGVPAKSVPVGVNTLYADLLVSRGQGTRIIDAGGRTDTLPSSPPAGLVERCSLVLAADGATAVSNQRIDEPNAPGRFDIWLENRRIQKAQIGELKVSSWDQDSICINGCTCKFADGGKQLVCPDRTYEAAETPKTIIISKEGKTREQTDP